MFLPISTLDLDWRPFKFLQAAERFKQMGGSLVDFLNMPFYRNMLRIGAGPLGLSAALNTVELCHTVSPSNRIIPNPQPWTMGLRFVGDVFSKYWSLTSQLTDDGRAGGSRSEPEPLLTLFFLHSVMPWRSVEPTSGSTEVDLSQLLTATSGKPQSLWKGWVVGQCPSHWKLFIVVYECARLATFPKAFLLARRHFPKDLKIGSTPCSSSSPPSNSRVALWCTPCARSRLRQSHFN